MYSTTFWTSIAVLDLCITIKIYVLGYCDYHIKWCCFRWLSLGNSVSAFLRNYAPLMMLLLEEEAANEDPTTIGLHSQLSRHRLAVSSPKRQTTTVLWQSSALAASQIRAQISSTTDQISGASTIVNATLRDHLPTSAPTEALLRRHLSFVWPTGIGTATHQPSVDMCQGMEHRWHIQICWRSFYSIVDTPCIPQKRWLWQASTSCLCSDVRKAYRWLCFCSAPPAKPFPICQ